MNEWMEEIYQCTVNFLLSFLLWEDESLAVNINQRIVLTVQHFIRDCGRLSYFECFATETKIINKCTIAP